MKRLVSILGVLLNNLLFAQQPNVVLVMTDDQGYGDLSAHGNPWIQTPNLDKLHSESIRFTNFHVGTTCAPTRGMLMTGVHCNKSKVWHTVKTRSLLKADLPTMADIFKKGGYATGIFGKWHLGDNYPFRPQDRGFDTSVVHGAGGIGQAPDYWLNDYFDDTYLTNGVPKKYKGYCTDIFFDEAMKFIDASKESKKPFFCYIATNAPHGPLNVAEKYRKMYEHLEGDKIPKANFYGMIFNVDENILKIRTYLEKNKLTENTIFIYMTDNGTAFGYGKGKKKLGFNAGMQGTKGSQYEGGHRVPFFLHWPKKKLNKGRDVNNLTVVTDILPTLSSLCGLKSPKKIDGKDISDLIYAKENDNLNDRIEVIDTQRMDKLVYEKQFAVMQGNLRLVGSKLFDISKDPGQSKDIAAQYPEKVKELRMYYDNWWGTLDADNLEYERITLNQKEAILALSVHDMHPIDPKRYNVRAQIPYSQNYVRKGVSYDGEWSLKNCGKKNYTVSLSRWPSEANLTINEVAKAEDPFCEGCTGFVEGKDLHITKAILKIGEEVYVKEVKASDKMVSFDVKIAKGKFEMSANFETPKGKVPAYYVYVE